MAGEAVKFKRRIEETKLTLYQLALVLIRYLKMINKENRERKRWMTLHPRSSFGGVSSLCRQRNLRLLDTPRQTLGSECYFT
jgi:hypothetical protein